MTYSLFNEIQNTISIAKLVWFPTFAQYPSRHPIWQKSSVHLTLDNFYGKKVLGFDVMQTHVFFHLHRASWISWPLAFMLHDVVDEISNSEVPFRLKKCIFSSFRLIVGRDALSINQAMYNINTGSEIGIQLYQSSQAHLVHLRKLHRIKIFWMLQKIIWDRWVQVIDEEVDPGLQIRVKFGNLQHCRQWIMISFCSL